MIRTISMTSLALATFTALAFANPATAGDAVPFKGRLDGVVIRTPLNPTTLKVNIAATGNATHLGAYQATVPHLVNTAVTPRTAAGQYVFVAANGDRLVANFTGVSGPTPTPGVFAITELAVFDPVASTGRFAGATGGFKAERLFNTVAGTTTGAFVGAIKAGK